MHGQPGFTLIRALSDSDLRQRIADVRASVGDTPYLRELLQEQARRNDARRCPECHVHEQNGHLLTCERGARAGRTLRLVT
jgi:lipopolysaccharide biosynthesis regulator YciM